MRVTTAAAFAIGLQLCSVACSKTSPSPVAPDARSNGVGGSDTAPAPLSETPPFNLEAILRPVNDGSGFGHVKFRQPKDDLEWIYLDVWVRDLAPNTTYLLQRAVDTQLDAICTGAGWLTLGQDNVTPGPIVTDANGTGHGGAVQERRRGGRAWRWFRHPLPRDSTVEFGDSARKRLLSLRACVSERARHRGRVEFSAPGGAIQLLVCSPPFSGSARRVRARVCLMAWNSGWEPKRRGRRFSASRAQRTLRQFNSAAFWLYPCSWDPAEED